MLETAQSTITRVGKKIGLTDAQIKELLTSDAEHKFTIKLSNGKEYPAYRVQHNNKLGPYKGGTRFHPEVSLEEVRALATLMSLKTAAVGLPYGGGKGGITVVPHDLSSAELEELSRKYAAHLTPHIGPDKDIPGPDVNTNAQIMDWMMDEFEATSGDTSHASFTGKTIKNGGSLGRDASTGRGGVFALSEFLSLTKADGKPITYVVQGFGNVGSFFGTIAEEEHKNWKLIGVSDSSSGIYEPKGLSAKEMNDFKAKGGRFKDLPAGKKISSDELLTQEADVLVLAALGDTVTEANMANIKARIVLELSNGPTTEKAQDYLTNKGVTVIPDFIANAGGVIVSYLEWVQNRANEHWTETKVNAELKKYIVDAVKNTYHYAEKEKVTLKEAAFSIAIRRLTS